MGKPEQLVALGYAVGAGRAALLTAPMDPRTLGKLFGATFSGRVRGPKAIGADLWLIPFPRRTGIKFRIVGQHSVRVEKA